MIAAAPSPASAPVATDPLDFSLADRLPARRAGQGRLIAGAPPQDGRPGLLFVPGAYHGAWCYAHYLDYFAAAGLACAALDESARASWPRRPAATSAPSRSACAPKARKC
ncbi:hypothetical protein [Achromobacter sp. UMC46]|uniref:hypothetical protein n=1 Tax=Achromobacter sp. UMC46 TaxID=1862319 RepID=UPI00210829D4|nr:hypothetical protein [Achromobacter sp. UMC46]